MFHSLISSLRYKLLALSGRNRVAVQLGVVMLVVCAGTWLTFRTHAATSTISVEAEKGALAGSAAVTQDSAASGSQAVKFGGAAANTGMLTISISGNHFVDQAGAAVQLRGVNRSGTQYACMDGYAFSDGPIDDASIVAMKTWGINAVRVNGNEDCWLGINGAPAAYSGANYEKAIGDFVARLNAHGLYVIYDLHHSAPGTAKALDQQPMADRDHAPAYWTSVASYFKNNHAVIFDLYNEPYPDSNKNTTAAWTCLRDGGTCPGVSFTAAGMQELVNAVRGAGATNPILIGGPQYAGVVDRWQEFKPNDSANQLAASIHIYYNTPSSPEWAPCYLESCWNNTMAPLAQKVPVVIGEVGEHDCNTGLILGTAQSPKQSSLYDWSDAHGVSYLGWSWFTGNCAAEPALISNYDGTPTAFGAGLKTHLLSLPH